MPFTTVGIQSNLPVLPIHVLQIIEALTQFNEAYSGVDFYRQGRTNFGAANFTSSAHVEMHSYDGNHPLIVYGGPADSTQVFSVSAGGSTTATSVTASTLNATNASAVNAVVTNATIGTEAVVNSTITNAQVTSLLATNGVISTLNSNVGAIATFTASNASVTNNLTASNLYAGTLRSPSVNLTGSLLGTASYADASTSASYALSASQADDAVSASYVSGSNVDGTVVSASYAVTASYALNSTSGGPGGGQGMVQYYSASLFAGIPTLIYDGTTLYATGSFRGDLAGTASFVNLTGQGITVNGTALTASVRTVNGINPTNGNIAVSLAGVLTGLSSSNYAANLLVSSSGAITASISNGALWVVSGETGSLTSGSNGQVWIFRSASVGQWLRVAPLDTAAADARYLMSNGGNTLTADLNFSGYSVTNAGTWFGTASRANTGSFVTASNVFGPYGGSSILSASHAVSASWAPSPNLSTVGIITTGSTGVTQSITGSVRISGSGEVVRVTGTLRTVGNIEILDQPGSVPSRLESSNVVTNQVYPTTFRGARFNNGFYQLQGGGQLTEQSVFPSILAYFNGGSTAASDGFTTITSYPGHAGIGYYGDYLNFNYKLPAIFIHTKIIDAPTVSPNKLAVATYRTIISDNNTIPGNGFSPLPTNATIEAISTANAREHVLVVTGSMLARDGVSLGTNIANEHYITGSVNMTGSLILNGTNLGAASTSPVQVATVDLSQAQILNLFSSPAILVPAPGIGKYISVIHTTLYYNHVSAPYATNVTLYVYNGTSNIVLNAGAILSYDQDVIFSTPGSTGDAVGTYTVSAQLASSILNQPVIIKPSTSGNPTGGNGTIRARVLYTIENAL